MSQTKSTTPCLQTVTNTPVSSKIPMDRFWDSFPRFVHRCAQTEAPSSPSTGVASSLLSLLSCISGWLPIGLHDSAVTLVVLYNSLANGNKRERYRTLFRLLRTSWANSSTTDLSMYIAASRVRSSRRSMDILSPVPSSMDRFTRRNDSFPSIATSIVCSRSSSSRKR